MKLLEQSYNYLEGYLKSNPKLSIDKKEEIESAMAEKLEKNKVFADNLINSELYGRAVTSLVNLGVAEKVTMGERTWYELDLYDTFLAMLVHVSAQRGDNKTGGTDMRIDTAKWKKSRGE